MDQTVEKTVDRLSELLDRANKAAQDFEVKDRLSDAVAALRRTRITQDSDSGVERFVTGLLIGVAVGFGLALLLAPKSGEEMRDDLMQRGIELRDRAGELASRRPFGDGEQGRTEKASSDQPRKHAINVLRCTGVSRRKWPMNSTRFPSAQFCTRRNVLGC